MDIEHFNRKPLRSADTIKTPNTLKAKVGSGGLSEYILEKAQELLENNTVDFTPLGEMYLEKMMHGISKAEISRVSDSQEELIAGMLYPAMQLKANGGMFRYLLITRIADRMIQFLEVIEHLDNEVLEICQGFHATMRAVILGKITGSGGQHGEDLVAALNEACMRYFEKHPDNLENWA